MKRIALYHLETLLWISRLGTFRAAADRLNTTQPAISARIRELESQTGLQIFRREGRNMVLTVRGRQLVQDCEPLWSAIERTLLADDKFAGATGVVRIGTGEIAAASCLPGFVERIEEDLPGVTLEISLDLTANLLQQLLASVTDMVLLAGPIASPGVRTAPIGTVELRWLANVETARRMCASQKDDWLPPIWSLPRHSPLHQIMRDTLQEQRVGYRSLNNCNNVRTLIDIISRGQGIALLPEVMVREDIRDGRLVEILPRPSRVIMFQAAIRNQESDPVVLNLFKRAGELKIPRALL